MKSVKNLLVPAIVLAVLIIGAILWFALKPSEEVVEENTSISVLSLSSAQLKAINVQKKIGVDVRFELTTDADSVTTWTLVDDDPTNDEAILSPTTVSGYISALTSFMANSVITEPSSLSDYGLDDPEFIITYELNDGTTKTLKIGNTTYDGGNCYFMVDGDPNVYTCITIKRVYADYGYIDFLSSQILNIAYNNIATVTFDRTTDGTHFTATCEMLDTGSPVYYCIDPFQIKTSSYFENLVEDIVNLEIAGFVDIPDESLAEYGLDNPAFTFTFVLRNGETTVIELSQNLNGSFYGRCTGIDQYFQLSSMQISGLETPVMQLLSDYLTNYNAAGISSIRGTYGDASFEYVLDVPNAISDPGAVVTLNGRNAYITNSQGRRSYAAILFEHLVCIPIAGIDLEANPEFESIMTFTYVTKDYKTTTLDFVQRDDNSYYVFVNGEYSSFYVLSRSLFRNAGTDTFSYGAWAAYELCETAIDNAINGTYDIPEEG